MYRTKHFLIGKDMSPDSIANKNLYNAVEWKNNSKPSVHFFFILINIFLTPNSLSYILVFTTECVMQVNVFTTSCLWIHLWYSTQIMACIINHFDQWLFFFFYLFKRSLMSLQNVIVIRRLSKCSWQVIPIVQFCALRIFDIVKSNFRHL